MEGLAVVLALLMLVALVALLVGFFRPRWVVPWMKAPTRLKAAGFWLVALIIVFGATAAVAPKSPDGEDVAQTTAPSESQSSTPAPADFDLARYRELCLEQIPDDIYNQRCAGKSFAGEVYVVKVNGVRALDVRDSLTASDLTVSLELAEDATWDAVLTSYVDKKALVTGTVGAAGFMRRHVLEGASIQQWLDLSPEETAQKAANDEARAALAEKEKKEAFLLSDVYPACVQALEKVAKYPTKLDCPWFPGIDYEERETGWVISSSCDMMNSLGNMVPSKFVCTYGDGAVTSINLAD